MGIRALIIDDEFNCRENLKILINDYCPEIEIVGLAGDANQARTLITQFDPDVVFLDIAMPTENGFELLNNLPNRDFSVVFTTAHTEYALDAFKADALDYIEKPIDIDDLRHATEKIMKAHDFSNSPLNDTLEENNQIIIPTRTGYEFINNEDVIHLRACENYTEIFLTNGKKIMSSKTLKTYDEKINEDIFFRTHKSHIVNIKNHLKSFTRDQGHFVTLTNDIEIPISRRKLSCFMQRIQNQ